MYSVLQVIYTQLHRCLANLRGGDGLWCQLLDHEKYRIVPLTVIIIVTLVAVVIITLLTYQAEHL